MHGGKRSTYVQSFVCVKCLVSFEVICAKTYNEEIEKHSNNCGTYNLFPATRGAQQTADI